MISKIFSYELVGLNGVLVTVETDVQKGLPSFDTVGLPDTAVKESKNRVRSAIKNSLFDFPCHSVTVNLAPASVKKEGAHYDLAIAIGLLTANGTIPNGNNDTVFLGELALNGDVRKVEGIFAMLVSAKEKGYKNFVIPKENEKEAGYVGLDGIYAVSTLKEAVGFLQGTVALSPVEKQEYVPQDYSKRNEDMSLIHGQPVARRAVEVAVAGGHNVLLVGPPGSGKSMLAKSIPTIMPDMSRDEAMEITKIHSVAGCLGDSGMVTRRPFRTPHHTTTTVALCGGGNNKVHPGEISLAHGGVLFLDELPEYKRSSLEALRQPLEDGVITVSRAGGTVTYPADFMLCASMNPCPCGNYGSSQKPCTCTKTEIKRYQAKISGPLLDRIDIQVEVDAVKYDDLTSTEQEEPSSVVKARSNVAREIQRRRFEGTNITCNAQMGERELRKYCVLDKKSEEILRASFERLKMSARARSRILKVARTIADLDLSENIEVKHILEAISYRTYGTEQD